MAPVIIGPYDDLEVMSVYVERMFASIIVVEDDLDDVILFEDIAVGVATVYRDIRCVATGRKSRVERGNHWCGVRDVVEEGAAAVSIVHTFVVSSTY